MRQAGGLAFGQAHATVEMAMFRLEQATPESARAVFVRDRNRILAANAVLSWVLGDDRLRTEALLAGVTSLLSLLMLVKAPDARALLEGAVRQREPAQEAGTRPKRRRIRSLNSLSPADTADSISLLSGVMFEYDGSGLESYWDEVLVSEAICDPGVHLACCIRRPQDLALHLLRDLVRGFTGDELVLPPIDAQLERNSEIDNALKPYLGTARYHLSEQDVYPLHGMAQRPLEHARTKAVIGRYEDWLYPGGRNASSSLRIDMVWEPWEDLHTDATLWEDLFG